jgi:hypothetical protein
MKTVFEHGNISPRDMALIINTIIDGDNNASNQITLGSGTTTTFESDTIGTRINEKSVIMFMPLSAAAAVELYSGAMFCAEATITNGEFIVTHGGSASGLEFRILVMGGAGL